MYSKARGFTFVEMLIALSVCVLLFGMAMPGLGSIITKTESEIVVNDVVRLMAYARNAAVTEGSTVTLCRSADGHSCGGQWEQGVLLFTDINEDGTFDEGEDRILRQTNFKPGLGTLRLRSFPNRQYLQFTALGFTNKQNGTFTWCPADHNAELAQQIIFIQSGRTRLARDTNGDKIREGTDGKPISCE